MVALAFVYVGCSRPFSKRQIRQLPVRTWNRRPRGRGREPRGVSPSQWAPVSQSSTGFITTFPLLFIIPPRSHCYRQVSRVYPASHSIRVGRQSNWRGIIKPFLRQASGCLFLGARDLFMAVKAVIPFLVGMMLLTGCANTILTKYQDQQCVRNCEDKKLKNHKTFEQPVIQT